MKSYFIIVFACIFFFACGNKNSKNYYQGKEPDVMIQRDKYTKKTEFTIKETGDWRVFSGSKPDLIDFSKPLLTGKGSGTFSLDVPENTRSYFCIETSEGKTLVAETHLPMEGGYNFRDLGGLKTQDGKHVKWGVFFRTDDMHNLTPADLDYLSGIPIQTIVDFRTKNEITDAPDKIPTSVKHAPILHISPGNINDIAGFSLDQPIPFDLDSLMVQLNDSFVTDSSCIKVYRQFFSFLQQDEYMPVLYHCSAGKDRTGYASALILFALGVDEKTVIDNYVASNHFLGDKYRPLIDKNPQLEPLLTVKAEYIQAAIDQMKSTSGSVDNYLSQVLYVDIQKFRNTYLEF